MITGINVKELYTQYGPLVIRRCQYLLKNKQEAYDAAQDVFVQLLRRKNLIKNNNLSGYIYKTASNICLNKLRKQNKLNFISNQKILTNIPVKENFENFIHSKLTVESILKNEKELNRNILTLHYIKQLTLLETGKIIGMSVSGIRKRLRKMKKKY